MRQDDRENDILSLCRSVPASEPSPGFSDRVMAAVRKERLPVRGRTPVPVLWATAGTFAFALLLAGWFFLGRTSLDVTQPDTALVASYVEDHKAQLETFCDAPDEDSAFEFFMDFWEYSRSRGIDGTAGDEKAIRNHFSWMMDHLESLIG